MSKKQRFQLWLSNIKRRSILKVPSDFDISLTHYLKWSDLVYCNFSLWHVIIPAMLKKEHIPSGVVLVDAQIPLKTMEWANKIARQLVLDE